MIDELRHLGVRSESTYMLKADGMTYIDIHGRAGVYNHDSIVLLSCDGLYKLLFLTVHLTASTPAP